jgi:hypothetical protein
VTLWFAGLEITAERLNDGPPVTQITTGLTAQSGFSVSSFSAYKIGHLLSFNALIASTNAITATSGNIGDTSVALLPAGWWPLDQPNGTFGSGAMDGEFIVNTSGMIQIRSANASIAAGNTMRFTITYPFAT